jgi:hypothetical protein
MKKKVVVSLVSGMAFVVAGVLVLVSGGLGSRVSLSSTAYPRSIPNGSHTNLPDTLTAQTRQRIAAEYGKLPLSFEANRGQSDPRVKFISRGQGYSLFLTDTGVVLALTRRHGSEHVPQPNRAQKTRATGMETAAGAASAVLRVKLAGANPAPRVEGLEQLPGRSNYFIGNDPAKWRTDVPQYAKVRYRDVYPGVDLVYYGNQQHVEHDFIVAPGADPSQIRFSVDAANRMELSATGDLVLHTTDGDVRLRKPTIYEQDGAARKEVAGGYTVTADNRVGFELAAYDVTKPLVIDPVLEYATYVGGSLADNGALALAVDVAGSAYIAAWTDSTDFPTQDPLQSQKAGPPSPSPGDPEDDIYVTKLTPDGSALVYSTYLGGSDLDHAEGIAVDRAGNATLVGRTLSTDFPVQNALQPTKIAGRGKNSAVVVKLNAQGNALIYSTYLGGSGVDFAYGIAADADGNAYVAGMTNSPDFPQKGLHEFVGGMCHLPPAPFDGSNGLCVDIFVVKLPPDGSRLVYSARLGGSGNSLFPNIAVDRAGNAYVEGQTDAQNFPTTSQAFQSWYGGGAHDVFVSKLDARGNALVFSTYLGGAGDDGGPNGGPAGIALTPGCGAPPRKKTDFSTAEERSAPCFVYVTGTTNSTDFPTTPGAFQSGLAGGSDAFVAKLNPDGSGLIYSTYLGGTGDDLSDGIRVDAAGHAYVAGETTSPIDFPTTDDALQRRLSIDPTIHCPPTSTMLCSDMTLSILAADGSRLVYSTYLGGTGLDVSRSIALHPSGCGRAGHDEPGVVGELLAQGHRGHLCDIYVGGATTSQNFPTTENAFQRKYGGGGRDAFVVKFSSGRRDHDDAADDDGARADR